MRVICCYSNGWVACSGLEWQAGCDEGWLGWMWTTAGGDRERQISPHVDRRRRGGGLDPLLSAMHFPRGRSGENLNLQRGLMCLTCNLIHCIALTHVL
jgi:hypothetical protein